MSIILLENGADVNSLDNNGDSVIMWLFKYKSSYTDIMKVLIKYRVNLLIQDNNGDTLMHFIAQHISPAKNYDLIVSFYTYINGGYKLIDTKNNQGFDPYELAIRYKNMFAIRFIWDCWMYKNLPYFVPILSSTLMVIFSIYFIMKFKIFYGLLFSLIIIFTLEQLRQPTIVIGKSRNIFGLVIGLIISILYSHYNYMQHDRKSLNHNDIIIYLSGFLTLFFLYKTSSSKAKKVDSDDIDRSILIKSMLETDITAYKDENISSTPIDEIIDKKKSTFNLCTTCVVDKSDKLVHCSVCDKCFIDLDHHCPFVLVCVGKGNRRSFTLFTLFGSFGCFYFSYLSYFTIRELCTDKGIFPVQTCLFFNYLDLFILSWVAFFFSIWIFSIFVSQLYLIGLETTTADLKNYNHDGKCREGGFTKGFDNVVKFCLTGEYTVSKFPVRAHFDRINSSNENDEGTSLLSNDHDYGHTHNHDHGHHNCSHDHNNNKFDTHHHHNHSHKGSCCENHNYKANEIKLGNSIIINVDDR